MKGLKFYLDRVRWGEYIEMHIRQDLDKKYAIGKPIVMEVKEEPFVSSPPALTFDSSHAQQLMDELWRIGFRPSEGTGSAGALAAVQYHLEDMRKLVFDGKRDEDKYSKF